MTQSTSEFIMTSDIVTTEHLQTIIGTSITDNKPIQVCGGEWRRYTADPTLFDFSIPEDSWVFWEDPDWSEES